MRSQRLVIELFQKEIKDLTPLRFKAIHQGMALIVKKYNTQTPVPMTIKKN